MTERKAKATTVLVVVVPTLSRHPNDEDLSFGTPVARKDGAPGLKAV